jgi:glycosyltransferase involved in cell wall biosynthesis
MIRPERILYILPYPMYPPQWGPQNHTFQLLKYITQKCECHVVGFQALPEDKARWQEMASILPNTKIVRITTPRQGLNRHAARVRCFVSGLPVSLAAYDRDELHHWLSRHLETTSYDLVHFDTFNVSVYQRDCATLPTVLVPHDAYSLEAQRGLAASRRMASRLSYHWKRRAYSNYERRMYPRFTKVCPVSEVDTVWLRSINSDIDAETLEIAVGSEFLDAQAAPPAHERSTPHIICCGFLANEAVAAGMIEFLEEVYPEIRKNLPDAKITVWGRNPTAPLRRVLSGLRGINYVEYVEDYRAFLATASLYILPQRSGAGIQTKVQQAMALGIPVVMRPHVLEALKALNGVHAIACDSNTAMAQAAVRLVRDESLRESIGGAAADYIRNRFAPEIIGRKLESIYTRAIKKHRESASIYGPLPVATSRSDY